LEQKSLPVYPEPFVYEVLRTKWEYVFIALIRNHRDCALVAGAGKPLLCKGDFMSKEKRRFSRIPFQVNAEITVDREVYQVAKINNLSIGGGFFPLDQVLAPGSPCEVKIILNGTSSELSIRVSGLILRSSPGALAIQFTTIDPDSLFHLQNIIRFNATDPDSIEREIDRHPGLI
jgi:hypothetical protein